ncbi:hypothetical protein CERSUDRAFT_122341 [Gelatoporia subvermispora B]|uniref:DUF6534 domain-containing protein n=1 Tax=Ceriporiopsis subvermispora (strain B) TaxID=914234 RepID=M2QNY7_CERS8|nr:hypothetical protein CERSUDRAFT_122341 [Gelatoporia subvermispora B]
MSLQVAGADRALSVFCSDSTLCFAINLVIAHSDPMNSSSLTHSRASEKFETGNTLGALLIGVIIQAVFYGNLCALTWRYYRRCRGDPAWLRALVAFIGLMCTFSLVTTTHAVYTFTVIYFANPIALENGSWSTSMLTTVNAIVVVLVRFVFIQRVYKFSRGRGVITQIVSTVLVLTAALSLVDLASSIALTVRIFQHSILSTEVVSMKILWELVFGTGIPADFLLTVLLCFCLHNSRTGLTRTDSVINLLILYSIETGIFPALIELAGLIAFLLSPRTFIYIPFYVQIANLYLTSLVVSLNRRDVIRRKIEQPITVDFGVLDDSICVACPQGRLAPLSRPPHFHRETDSDFTTSDTDVEKGPLTPQLELRPNEFGETSSSVSPSHGRSSVKFDIRKPPYRILAT